MNIAAATRVLSNQDIEHIHAAMLRIVSEVGVKVENETILSRLAEVGGRVDRAASTVRLALDFAEGFIAASREFDWEAVEPHVGANAHISLGWYLDPETDDFVEHTEERIATYAKLAHYLDQVDGANMLGCPIAGVPKQIHPFYQRYLC